MFAHHFRQPVPRWADEGGSVYSEDDQERTTHDKLCRQILNRGSAYQLKGLFAMKEYPRDVMNLYAEGYSVMRFLVEKSDRQTFLNFVSHGLQHGWDDACKTHYGYAKVDELERDWLDHLHKTRGRSGSSGDDSRLVLRESYPPARPALETVPVSRGAAPSAAERDDREIGWTKPAAARLSAPMAPLDAPPSAEERKPAAETPPVAKRPARPTTILMPPEHLLPLSPPPFR